ncbi:hypothetical protein FRC05_008984 [Tulasnella sp. 425]|nr:hypothetical protein FRC05_008984 [Tulasnella sp. 425]
MHPFRLNMHPYHHRPLVQSSVGGESQPSSSELFNLHQQINSDAQRQQRISEYQPALLFNPPPPPSYPPSRWHPSLIDAPAASQPPPAHNRITRPEAGECNPDQFPSGIPLRISDAINRPPPLIARDENLASNFTISPAVPILDIWSSRSHGMDRVEHVQHSSPFPLPVQNETPSHLSSLRHDVFEIPALVPSSLAHALPGHPDSEWSDPVPPPPYAEPLSSFPVRLPKGSRRPRREILAGIKHMIFIWRVETRSSTLHRPRPTDGVNLEEAWMQPPKPSTFLSPVMDRPLLCTFRLAGTYPTIDSQLELVREKEEDQKLGFPFRTPAHSSEPQLVSLDGIAWLVEPSLAFPTLSSIPADGEEELDGTVIKLEDDGPETFIQHEVATPEFPTLPALSYGSSESSALPPLASIASPPFLFAPHTTTIDLAPQHLNHAYRSFLPAPAHPATTSLGPLLYPPAVPQPPSSFRPSVVIAPRSVGAPQAEDQVHRPAQSRDRVSRTVRPQPTATLATSGPSDVLLSKNLMDVLLASVAAPPPKNYVCKVCNKAFERRASLETHMTVHSGQRPHKCPVPQCARDFSVRSNFRRHLRTHGLDPRRVDCDGPDAKPQSVLEAVKRTSGLPYKKRRTAQYSSGESDVEPGQEDGAPVQLDRVGPVAVAAAGAGGNGERPGGWGPVPSVGPTDDEAWIPESLRQFQNAHLLSDKPPFDLSGCGTAPSMPLPPVHPWGSPTSPTSEERNSFDSNVSETPYHPNQVRICLLL